MVQGGGSVKIKNIRYKRWIVLISTLILLVSSLQATIFVDVNTDANLDVPEDVQSLQLMASDWNHDGKRVLQKDGGVLKLDLGTWVTGTSKTYPASLAIVNPSDKQFTITNVSLPGAKDNLKMYLHTNRSRPCDSGLVNVDKTEAEENKTLVFDNGTSYESSWTLGAGQGYQENKLLYSNETESSLAPKKNSVWTHNETGPRVAEEGVANFVWVELSVTSSEADEGKKYRGPLEIEIDGDFESTPKPNIAFMGSGRRDGGPVISKLGGNTFSLSASNLKNDSAVVIPDALAIVNTGSNSFRITNVSVEGDSEGYMRVWLHGDPYSPAGDYGLSVDRDENNISYYDENGVKDRSDNGWVLGSGFGYDQQGKLRYGREGEIATARRTAGYPNDQFNLWMLDSEATNSAVENDSNFVWVEIAYVLPNDAQATNVDSNITFNFSSV